MFLLAFFLQKVYDSPHHRAIFLYPRVAALEYAFFGVYVLLEGVIQLLQVVTFAISD